MRCTSYKSLSCFLFFICFYGSRCHIFPLVPRLEQTRTDQKYRRKIMSNLTVQRCDLLHTHIIHFEKHAGAGAHYRKKVSWNVQRYSTTTNKHKYILLCTKWIIMSYKTKIYPTQNTIIIIFWQNRERSGILQKSRRNEQKKHIKWYKSLLDLTYWANEERAPVNTQVGSLTW